MENKENDQFEDISSNENVDIFSYDNSGNTIDSGEENFDLNNFSSKTLAEQEEKERNQKKKRTGKQKVLIALLSIFLIGTITVSIAVGGFLFYAFKIVGGEDLELEDALDFTTTIYVEDGNSGYKEYRRVHGEYNRIWKDYLNPDNVELPEDYDGIPQILAKAFIAIEDKRFSEHDGVDWKRTLGAFVNEFLPIYSSRQGGSTITQQLVKNITGDREQVATRKIREIITARNLEGKYSKDKILETYLNTIPMNRGIHGVEVAANYYFGKTVKDLTIAECACLASITKSPTYYAPDKNPENNKERRESVLFQMYDQGYITKEEYDAALKEELNIVADERVLSQTEINSYYIDALINEVCKDLVDQNKIEFPEESEGAYDTYEKKLSYARQQFYKSGYKVYATVSPEMQEAAEKVFSDAETYAIKGKDGTLMTGGITIMDYEGNVKALVGGIGEKTINMGFNTATDAVRQPGSTMKPIAAYAPAIEQNLITYSTLVNDTKTTYNGWSPVNWYSSYWGNITIEYALERSVNTIPVYLVDKMTPAASFKFLTEKLGVTTLNSADMDLSPLGMGGTNGGLTTIESAAAFAVFGNGGVYYEPKLYTKVTDQQGNVILQNKSKPKVAISDDTATVMNHLLQNVVYGSKGTGTAAASYIPSMKIYAKTGTSNDQNDLWFVGGTPYYVASVWCGYEVQQPIPSAYSGIALKMWGNVMSKVHSGLPAKEFLDSSYAVDKYYCTTTGLLATDACTDKKVGWYKKNNVPSACTAHSGQLLGDPGTLPEETTPPAEGTADSTGGTDSANNEGSGATVQ